MEGSSLAKFIRANSHYVSTLTPTQYRVLEMMGGGYTNRAIAGLRRNSVRSVEHHIREIFIKLRLSDGDPVVDELADRRVTAVLMYLRYKRLGSDSGLPNNDLTL